MSAGFSQRQLKKLATALDHTRVHTRQQDGKTLSYVEGWFALHEANRIFGYDGWDREMVHCERVFERKASEGISCGYVARVRVRVRANATTILREGTGFGQASAPTQGDAHERALKAAETDATKRALVTFGGRFGLMLYDKEQRPATGEAGSPQRHDPSGVKPRDRSRSAAEAHTTERGGAETPTGEAPCNPDAREDAVHETQAALTNDTTSKESSPLLRLERATYRLVASDSSSSEVQSPESFCTGLRQLIEAARSASELARLRWENEPTLFRLRQMPDLVSSSRRHYADILERLIATRTQARTPPAERVGEPSRTRAESVPGIEIKTVTDASLSSPAEPTLEPSALEAAIAEARPVDDAGLPKFYEPFVSVPAYPLSSLSERFRAAKPGSRTKEPDQRLGLETSGSATVAHDASASSEQTPSQDGASVPTRRSQITGGFSIDKSALLIPSERRLRSKAHLQFVASKPCLVCESLPCHAHHVTFAQSRGLSQKVSDEFTVPLCAMHHNELHAFGNEASWWRTQGIEPLTKAGKLWLGSVKGASGLDTTP